MFRMFGLNGDTGGAHLHFARVAGIAAPVAFGLVEPLSLPTFVANKDFSFNKSHTFPGLRQC